jgi:hypothetical protein
MAVAARFQITDVNKGIQSADGPSGVIFLRPDLSKNGGNEAWAKYTPAGEIRLSVNGPAFPWFEERLGKVVAITFDDVSPVGE